MLLVGEDNNDDGQVEVWLTNFEDEEVRKQTHWYFYVVKEAIKEEKIVKGLKVVKGGMCLMVNSMSSNS